MLQQSESADDEIEHFVDVDNENEKQQAGDKSTKEVDNIITQVRVPDNNNSDSDDDSVEDVPGSESDSDDASDEAVDFVVGVPLEDIKEKPLSSLSNLNTEQPTVPGKSTLPGGYDPRHREPSYSNADRVSWWELTVLASHVHPSVSTMARTLLSGATIVYNGNPLNDLSLTSFLDKLMEKKPKRNGWHGGSDIEPAKKLDMSHQLIGSEILSLGDEDVPPEDLVFHKFYMNKMNSSKKPKKKKVKEDDDEDDLFGGDVSGDEEIEEMIDHELASEEVAEYDYSDLDDVAEEEEEELIGDGSDEDVDIPSDIGEEIDFDDDSKGDVGEEEDVEFGADSDDEDNDGKSGKRKRKQKHGGKGKSPFASIEDYEHLIEEDDVHDDEGKEKKKFKAKKKSKKSH